MDEGTMDGEEVDADDEGPWGTPGRKLDTKTLEGIAGAAVDAASPAVTVTVLMIVEGGTVTILVTVTVPPTLVGAGPLVVVLLGASPSSPPSGIPIFPGASPGTSTSTWKLLSICALIALV